MAKYFSGTKILRKAKHMTSHLMSSITFKKIVADSFAAIFLSIFAPPKILVWAYVPSIVTTGFGIRVSLNPAYN